MNGQASKFDPLKEPFLNIEDFVERISGVLRCPITIEDANHRLIAYSTHDDRTDPARIATIIGRRVPDKVINSLWKKDIIPSLLKTDEPLRIKKIDEIGLGNRVAVSIQDANLGVLGFIWALDDQQILNDQDLIFIKKAAQAAKKHLIQLQTGKNKKEEGIQEFFWQLLTGHVTSGDEIRKKFEIHGIHLPSMVSVIIFRFSEEIQSKLENKIAYFLKAPHRINILFYKKDFKDLILLVSPVSKQTIIKDIHEFIQTFSIHFKEETTFSTQAAIGNLYEDLEKVVKSYREALTVLDIHGRFPKETKHIYHYKDLGIYQFLDVLFEKRKKDGFENQVIKKLKEYDQLHNSGLLETLEVYLDKDNNINEAAKELHIHVNTLNYRLKRIGEIGEIDLRDPNQKITLYLDLKIEQLRRGFL